MSVDKIEDLISRRSPPGTIIYDLNGVLMFANKEAQGIMSALPDLKGLVRELCCRIKNAAFDSGLSEGENGQFAAIHHGSPHLAIRGFPIGATEDGAPRHIMVLIERIAEKRTIDLQKACMTFQISKREQEVLKFICEGKSNREIAEKLFISEQTVKDHIKKIMRKVGVNSRSALISAVY